MDNMKKIRPQDMAMEQIEWYIQENRLKPHAKLPSEREMCRMWGLNRSTLHAAIRQLTEERLLYSLKGSGTYVAPFRLTRNIQTVQSTSQAMREKGYFLWTEVLTSRIEFCDEHISRKLEIPQGSRTFRLCRLRIRNNIPLMLENSYVDYGRCEGIENHNFAEESFYQVLKGYGIRLTGGEEKIGITFATEEDSRILDVDEGQFLYHQTGIVKDSDGRAVEFFEILARPDQIQYTGVLKRAGSDMERSDRP